MGALPWWRRAATQRARRSTRGTRITPQLSALSD